MYKSITNEILKKMEHTFSSLSESLSEPPGSEPAPESLLPLPDPAALRPSLTTSINDVRALVFFHE